MFTFVNVCYPIIPILIHRLSDRWAWGLKNFVFYVNMYTLHKGSVDNTAQE